MTLVVHVQGTAAATDRAVVDDRAEFARDLLADTAAERGDPLAIEIRLEPVPHRLVQENSRPARSQNDGHLAGGGLYRVQHCDRLARSIGREMFRRLLFEEEIQLYPAAAPGVTAL